MTILLNLRMISEVSRDETKLYSLSSGYYDPETGRFVNPAPIASVNPYEIGGLNLYIFSGNNPLTFTNFASVSNGGVSFGKSVLNENQGTSSVSSERFNFGYFAGFIEYTANVALGFMIGVARNSGANSLAKSLSKAAPGIGKISEKLGYIVLAIDVTIGLISDFCNGESWSRITANVVVDVAVGLFAIAATQMITAMIIGATIGSAVPIVGNLIGLFVGLAVGIGIQLFASDMIQDVKDGFTELFDYIGKGVKKLWNKIF